jgi:hypothetical protein
VAKMIALHPAPSVDLPGEGWTLIATEAGRYGDGLRPTLYARNGTLQTPGQLKLAHPKTWAAFVQEVADRSGCAPEAILAAIRGLTETIEVMLRPKPRPQPAASVPTGRRQIQVNARFDREIIRDAIEVLVGANDPPTLFMRGSEFVQVAPGAVEAERFDIPRLRSLVDELADCVTTTIREDGEETRPSRLPFTVCQDFLVKPLAQAFPPLSGIRTAPVFLPDGRLLAADGYDRASGYLLRLGDLHDIRRTRPVQEAREFLQQELLGDFPLVERYSQAHALALLLEPFVKPLIRDKTPLYAVDASTRGSGKGLLADVACRIATGDAAHVMALMGETAEDEKRITALLVSGASWILLDNVIALDSAPPCAVLTASIWRGRILGASRMVSVPNDATWVATGNNIRLSSEIARRVIPIRLEPQEERPEERAGFKHHPLLDWVRDHRAPSSSQPASRSSAPGSMPDSQRGKRRSGASSAGRASWGGSSPTRASTASWRGARRCMSTPTPRPRTGRRYPNTGGRLTRGTRSRRRMSWASPSSTICSCGCGRGGKNSPPSNGWATPCRGCGDASWDAIVCARQGRTAPPKTRRIGWSQEVIPKYLKRSKLLKTESIRNQKHPP